MKKVISIFFIICGTIVLCDVLLKVLSISDYPQTKLEDLRNLMLAVAAPITIALLTWRSIVADKQVKLTKESVDETKKFNQKSHSRDLLAKAIEALGSDKGTTRFSAIHILRMLVKSDSDYYKAVNGILYTFIWENSPRIVYSKDDNFSGKEVKDYIKNLAEYKSQIYEAIDVIKFLRSKNSKLKIDFRGVSIHGCNFVNFNMSDADLRGCEFIKCDFFGADLTGVIIKNSKFDESKFNSKTYVSNVYPYFGEEFEPTKFPKGFNPEDHGMIDACESKKSVYKEEKSNFEYA